MAKTLGYRKRFPNFGIFIIIAIALTIPITVWSLSNISTQMVQQAASSVTGSIMLNETNVTLGTNVTFTTTYSKNIVPRVEVLCYQDTNPSGIDTIYTAGKGYLVYGEARGLTTKQADYIGTNPIVLGGGMSAWLMNKGPADCVANLFYFGSLRGRQTYNVVDSFNFHAN